MKSTFGDQVGYLMPVRDATGPIRQSAPKRMHVSPFFDMQGGYRFSLTPPGERLVVGIRYGAAGQPRMTATMALTARPFSDASLIRYLIEMPFAPMKVMGAIHWQALKLWLRGARFHAMPTSKHDPVVAGEQE